LRHVPHPRISVPASLMRWPSESSYHYNAKSSFSEEEFSDRRSLVQPISRASRASLARLGSRSSARLLRASRTWLTGSPSSRLFLMSDSKNAVNSVKRAVRSRVPSKSCNRRRAILSVTWTLAWQRFVTRLPFWICRRASALATGRSLTVSTN